MISKPPRTLMEVLTKLTSLEEDEKLIIATILRYGRSTFEGLTRLCRLPEERIRTSLNKMLQTGRLEFQALGSSGFYDIDLNNSLSLGEPRFSWGPVIPLFRQFNLLCDKNRVNALAEAINHIVKPDDIVFDLGCGIGLLSLLAARKGARVFSVEIDPFVANMTECIFKTYLDPDQFSLFVEDARTFSPGLKADVIICEMLDTGLISEFQVPTMNYAISSLLKPGGTVIPLSADTRITAVEVDFKIHGWDFPLSHFDALDTNRVKSKISKPLTIHTADFRYYNDTQVIADVQLDLVNTGIVNAICMETSVIFHGDEVTNGSDWLNPPLILAVPVYKTRPGDKLRVRLNYQLGGTLNGIRIQTEYLNAGGER